jgi:hypothetical protein
VLGSRDGRRTDFMIKTKTGVLKELVDRNAVTASVNQVKLSADFAGQNEFVEDKARYVAAQCSRRAGKTNGLALRFFQTMEKYPKSQCLYLSLTQESARSIMWPILHEINDRFQLGCTFTESRLEMKYPNGAKLKLMGADLKDYIKRLKGRKFPGVGIDEAQDMGAHLQSLIDDVLTPSIADYADGWLALTGTPGPVPSGYYFDVTQNNKYGFKIHKWDLTQNPHMPDPLGFLNDLKSKRGWDDNNPTLQREYLNRWVLDVESLWVRYNEKINDYQDLPKDHKWNYIMGVDLGYNDADAITILAWSDTTPVTYLAEEVITKKQGLTELIEQMNAMHKKYDIGKVVMDEGGLGKKMAEEIRRRYAINVEPADKARKQENVEILNDSLRLGKFKAKAKSRFAQDSYLIQIDWDRTTPNKIVIKKKPHSDIIDAVLYAFRESYAFTHTVEPEKPRYGSREWALQQQNSMFEAELEGMLAEQELNERLWGKQ